VKYLSVCSGIEAASCAWHSLGWDPVAFSEIEPFPCSVLAERFPEVPNLGDMTKFKEWNLDRPIDLLVGGPPCQSFSVAGLRQRLTDPRGNLMLTFGAVAGHFKPSWIVWENVPGVLSSNKGRDFGSFLGMLGELGYGFAYWILDAQYFGVAQRRRRVFVVGYLGDWRRAAAVLFEPESLFGDLAPSRETGKGSSFELAPSLRAQSQSSHRADSEAYAVHDGRGRGGGDLVPTLCSDHAGRPSDFSPVVSMTLNAKGGSGRMDGESETLVPMDWQPDIVGCLAADIGGENQFEKSKQFTAQAHGVRRLTPRECERLQGFPDNWTAVIHRGKPAADGPRYRALGNSMAVPVMDWIGKRIDAEAMQLHLVESSETANREEWKDADNFEIVNFESIHQNTGKSTNGGEPIETINWTD
jgi:DNA (cytosine-5)-methyltransferase 1